MSRPFIIQGNSYLVAANASAPTGVQIVAFSNDIKTNTLRLHNADANQIIYWGIGATPAAAQANAVIPGATGNASLGLSPLMIEVVRVSIQTPQLFISGITASATQANLIVTPGDGV